MNAMASYWRLASGNGILARLPQRSVPVRLSLTGHTLVLLLATPLAAQDSPSRESSLAELEAAAHDRLLALSAKGTP